MNRLFKQVSAVGASLAMIATPVLAAGTLGDLPEPFVAGNSIVSAAIVVGNSADNAAGNTLQDYFTVAGAAGDIVSSSDKEEYFYGENLLDEFSATLDDTDLDDLFDGSIDYEGESYDTHEEVVVNSNMYIAVSGIENEEELGTSAMLYTNGTGSLNYRYVFDETFETGANVSSDDPLKITFLGQAIEVTDITDAATDSMTLQTSSEIAMSQDDEYVWSSHTIHVGTIFETSVEVWVDDESHEFLDEDESETWNIGSDTIQVEVQNIGYTEDIASRTVLVKIGEDITKTVTDGDAVETELGEPDVDGDENDAEWVWDISFAADDIATSADYIGIMHNQRIDQYDEDDFEPVGDGEYFAFPMNYITLDFDTNTFEDSDYESYMISFDSDDINATAPWSSSTAYILFEALDGDNDGIVFEGQDTERVACTALGKCFWENNECDWQSVANTTANNDNTSFYFEAGDSQKGVTFFNASQTIFSSYNGTYGNIAAVHIEDLDSGDETNDISGNVDSANLILNVSVGSQALRTAETEEADDVSYRFGNSRVDVGTWDGGDSNVGGGDALTAYGIKLLDLETNSGNDEVYFDIPTDDVSNYLQFNLRGSSATTMPAVVSPSNADSYSNLVLVGGPCVNELTAEWMGVSYPTCGPAASTAGIPVDQALIKIMEEGSKTALIVAGWETADTKRAADKVADAGLSGTEVLV